MPPQKGLKNLNEKERALNNRRHRERVLVLPRFVFCYCTVRYIRRRQIRGLHGMSGTAVAARAAAHVSSPFDNGGSHAATHGGALHSPLRTKEISSPTNMKASAWELLWSPYYVLLE